MAHEPSLRDMSTEQKEHWKNLTASLADPIAAVKLFKSNGVNDMLRKDLSFIMAFAVLVTRMGADEIAERAKSWMNLVQENESDPIKIVEGDVAAFLMQFVAPPCVAYHITRVDFAATIQRVAEARIDAGDFMQVFEQLLNEEKPLEIISYIYSNWILSDLKKSKHDLFLDVPQEIKTWAHGSECIRGSEAAWDSLSLLAHDEIPKDDEVFNRLTAGLCAYGCSAILHVVETRETLMKQDGEDWDATEETIEHLKWERVFRERAERKKKETFYLFGSIQTRLEGEFKNLLESCDQKIDSFETDNLDEAKRWARRGLDSLTDAEWDYIWSLVGLNYTSPTMYRMQFVIGTFLAEKYSVLDRDPAYGKNGFPITRVKLTKSLSRALHTCTEGRVPVTNLLEQ